LSRLRENLHLSNADLFEALVRELTENGYSRRGNVLQRVNFRPSLAPRLQAAGDRMRALLEARPLDPPARTELVRAAADIEVLRFLSVTGEIVLMGEDLAMSAEGFTKLKGMIEERLRGGRSATVSELRQATGTTRRVLVPLLEHLDRIGLTIRTGDRRRLR
jgi:selenocysteine-specific elongation factor